MPAGYETEEEARRRRERNAREAGADGRSRSYRGEEGEPGDWSGYDYDTYSHEPNISEHDRNAEGIPGYSWLSGADARADEARAEAEARRRRSALYSLARSAPTAEELTPEYYQEAGGDEYGDLLMGASSLEGPGLDPAEQRAALGQIGATQRALAELMRGGMTQADRQALTAQRLRQGAQLRGANLAAVQQMGARGMGGGGAELAARLAGSQDYANANAMGDAAIMGGAQQRALQAMMTHGQLGTAYGGIAGQMQGQELARRQAIDAYNRANYDWRRGREERNTGWANRQQDARSAARQQAYQNQERAVFGANDVDIHGSGSEDRRRGDDANQGLLAGLGELFNL